MPLLYTGGKFDRGQIDLGAAGGDDDATPHLLHLH